MLKSKIRLCAWKENTIFASALLLMLTSTASIAADAESYEALLSRVEALEAIIKKYGLDDKAPPINNAGVSSKKSPNTDHSRAGKAFVNVNPTFGYDVLDPTTNINNKQALILQSKANGSLKGPLTLSGAVTAIANYQKSNEADRFGYLMRHPTGANQVGKRTSEAAIHSAQLSLTASLGDWSHAYVEALYNPEQSFGSGTNTALSRNQLQARQAYVLFGNLDQFPVYASIGKMAIPFGLMDTVNPFTASSVWHAFGGLANGATVEYLANGFNASLMAVQGGAQFRAANAPVNGTAVPSELNNFAVDVNYTFNQDTDQNLLVGASYLRASAYCQSFPITHFSSCDSNNPAYSVYGKLNYDAWQLIAEFVKTTDEWPGTFNAVFPQFAASKVSSFGLGLRYQTSVLNKPTNFSAEFSRFKAGPNGAEWEKQDQFVLGSSLFLADSVKLFGEYIHTEGFTPLNFLSGGLGGNPAVPLSSRSANSDIILMGVNAAF